MMMMMMIVELVRPPRTTTTMSSSTLTSGYIPSTCFVVSNKIQLLFHIFSSFQEKQQNL